VNEQLATQQAPQAQGGAMVPVEQQRAVAEVQAALIMAQRNPRDQIRALDLIKQDCSRPGLAEKALYQYSRGGSDITGPSIRLAECIVLRWGNIRCGIREIERREGESLMQAYATDLESNVSYEMSFAAPHVRDTKKGSFALTDARDIYEAVSNLGSRRLRACILRCIPADIVEDAVTQVELTLKTKADVTPERVAKMLETFASFGVTKDQIEKRVQRRVSVETLTPALMLQLGKIANSLRDDMSKPGDWFEFTGSGAATAPGGGGAMLVSDVLAAGTASGWTVKELMDFITAKFGKALTALERGDQCVAAVQAIVAEAAAKDYRAAPPEGVVVPEGVATDATDADTAENAALDQELAAKESQAPASTPGMDAVSKAAAAAEASLFEAPFTPKPSPAPRGRGR